MVGRGALVFVAAALLVGGTACGSDDDSTVSGSSNTETTDAGAPTMGGTQAFETVDTIVIKSFEFNPGRPAAKVGDTIKIRNEDTALHSVTAKDDKSNFDSGQFASGEREITLSKAGTFDFACTVHPYMNGVIQVSA